MEQIDELLEQAIKYCAEHAPDPACVVIMNGLADTIRAQQAEIERLKGEYARGIEDAANVANNECGGEAGLEISAAIRALLQKQKEGE